MKETGLNGYVYGFSIDYDAIAVNLFFGCNVLNVNPLRWVSMNNQECKIKTKIIDINSNEPSFYPYSFKVNKCSDSCNNLNDPYTKLCVKT